MLNKLKLFLQESRRELQRVNWPSRRDTVRYTMIVIVMSLGVAVFLGGLDILFTYLLKNFLI